MELPSQFFLIVSMLSLAGFIAVFFGTAYVLASKVPPRRRVNMDEVPASLAKWWWMVSFFRFYVVAYLPKSWMDKRQKTLTAAGLEFFLMGDETYSLQCFAAFMFFVFASFVWFVADFDLLTGLFMVLVLTGLGWMYPMMWLTEQRKKRNLAVLRSIPAFLDILTLCCECGLNLNSGMTNYCEKGPKGPLRWEMERALRDMKGGASRVEALTKLSLRMANPDIAMFVSIVAQCEKLGVPLGSALRRFAEQKRSERFQRSEKLAMEAPMKIIGPLVIFIFPITFIIIAFPIASSMLENLK